MFSHQSITTEKCWAFHYLFPGDILRGKDAKVLRWWGPSFWHKWSRVWGHTSHTAASDLLKETRLITNRCHITFPIKVIKWVEIPKDEVIEVCAWGYIAQLPTISGEGELCTGNELWPSEFSLITAIKSIMCAPHQIIKGLLILV